MDKQQEENKRLENNIREKSGDPSTVTIILIIALIGLSIAFYSNYTLQQTSIETIKSKNIDLANTNNKLRNDNTNLSVKISTLDSKIRKLIDINIKVILFSSNLDGQSFTLLSNNLPSYKIGYLYPHITYDSKKGKNYKLDYKWFDSSGQLKTYNESPTGYTSSETKFSRGNNRRAKLLGWGKADGGAFESGLHKIEIWHNGLLLYSQTFIVN